MNIDPQEIQAPFVTMPVCEAIQMYRNHGYAVYLERKVAYERNAAMRDARLKRESEQREEEIQLAQQEAVSAYQNALERQIERELNAYNADGAEAHRRMQESRRGFWSWLGGRRPLPEFVPLLPESVGHEQLSKFHEAAEKRLEAQSIHNPHKQIHPDPDPMCPTFRKFSQLEVIRRKIENRYQDRWWAEVPDDPTGYGHYQIWKEIDELMNKLNIKTMGSLPGIRYTVTIPLRLMNPLNPKRLWVHHLEPETLREAVQG